MKRPPLKRKALKALTEHKLRERRSIEPAAALTRWDMLALGCGCVSGWAAWEKSGTDLDTGI